MKVLTSEEFLDADDLPLTPLELPESFAGKDSGVMVRTMSGTERGKLEQEFAGKDARDHPVTFRAALLIRTIVDGHGKPLFDEDDRDRLMDKNAQVIELIFEKACQLNGFTRKEVDERAKN